LQPSITVLSKANNPLTADLPSDIKVEDRDLSGEKGINFVIGTNVLSRPEVLKLALISVGNTGYIISRERFDEPTIQHPGINVVNEYRLSDERLVLLKKVSNILVTWYIWKGIFKNPFPSSFNTHFVLIMFIQ
jgi:hypothetical protein